MVSDPLLSYEVCNEKLTVSYGEYLSELLLHLSDETQPDKRIRYDDGWMGITTRGSSRNPNVRDHIGRYLAAEAKATAGETDIAITVDTEDETSVNGMKLLHRLVSCSEAVACRDRAHATALLTELGTLALVFGTAFQRVASCFVQGLSNRLESLQQLGAVGFKGPTNYHGSTRWLLDDKREETLGLVYDICPYIQFGHYVANSAILEAFERESYVHVVDLGMTLALPRGHQWRWLIHSLANRPGGPPKQLRITAVGLRGGSFRAIGDGLREYANTLCVNLKFCVVESSLEDLRAKDITSFEGEILVVNSILQLHRVVKESRGALNSVLKVVHELGPKVLVLVEQDSSHNGPFFLGRFMEALHYYAAIFDSLDAMLPKHDTRRAKVEQFYFGEEIKNIVSCEGPDRVERHERVDQWRRRMSRARFQASPIKMVARAKKWLDKNTFCDGYTIVEDKGCLVLGWKSRPIIAASCWKC